MAFSLEVLRCIYAARLNHGSLGACINVGFLNGCITQTLVDHEYDKWAQAILHPQLD